MEPILAFVNAHLESQMSFLVVVIHFHSQLVTLLVGFKKVILIIQILSFLLKSEFLLYNLDTTLMEEVIRTVEDAMDDENTCEFYTLFNQRV